MVAILQCAVHKYIEQGERGSIMHRYENLDSATKLNLTLSMPKPRAPVKQRTNEYLAYIWTENQHTLVDRNYLHIM